MDRSEQHALSRVEHFLAGILPLSILLILILLVALSFTPVPGWLLDAFSISKTIALPARAIFLAILTEAFPFILVGSLLSSVIQEYVTQEHITKWMPRAKLPAILTAALIGLVVPVCDCGTIPVARSLLQKGVARSAVAAFTLAAPVINPVTILTTYFAFGFSVRMALVRTVAVYTIACVAAFVSGIWKTDRKLLESNIPGLKSEFVKPDAVVIDHQPTETKKLWQRLERIVLHTVNELLDVGRYLFYGAAVAAVYQVYHTQHTAFGTVYSGFVAVVTLMVLAIVSSLCSQADAFVARSLSASFGPGAVMAFMVIGQMTDLRNLLLLPRTFGPKTASVLVTVCIILSLAVGLVL